MANGRRAALPRALDHRERDQHAEHPVVAAGVAHGVEMRAEQQRGRAAAARRPASDDVADRVAARGHPGVAHPAEHQVAGLRERGGGEAAGEPPGLLGAGGERVGPLEDGRGELIGRRHGGCIMIQAVATGLHDAIAELATYNDDPVAGGITREVYTRPTARARSRRR